MRLIEQDGTVLHEMADDGTGGRPEVQRGELRRILLDSLPADTVRWGAKVSGIRALGEGCEVTFADGGTVVTSLLASADGAWSRVRPLLSDSTPEYAGTSFVETYLFDADTRHTGTAKVVGGGSMIAPSPGKEIFAHREPVTPCTPTWHCPGRRTGLPPSISPMPPPRPRGSRGSSTAGYRNSQR